MRSVRLVLYQVGHDPHSASHIWIVELANLSFHGFVFANAFERSLDIEELEVLRSICFTALETTSVEDRPVDPTEFRDHNLVADKLQRLQSNHGQEKCHHHEPKHLPDRHQFLARV